MSDKKILEGPWTRKVSQFCDGCGFYFSDRTDRLTHDCAEAAKLYEEINRAYLEMLDADAAG